VSDVDHDDDAPTCGKGVAESAVIHERLSAFMRGMAGVLENHVRSLDGGEPNGRLEIDAYRNVIAGHRDVAERLDALASLMRGYRSLPMASHDMDIIMDKASLDAFAGLVDDERHLLAALEERVKEHGGMLDAMNEA
jgi:hypothetical protein